MKRGDRIAGSANRRKDWTTIALSLGAMVAATLLATCGAASAARAVIQAPMPLAEIEPDFDNPGRCAIVGHAVDVVIDPRDAGLHGRDTILLLHAPRVPADLPAAFLLHRDLAITGIDAASGIPLRWDDHQRWDPRDFWAEPEYAELEGLAHARQVDLFLDNGVRPDVWPESLLVTVHFAGTIYDSLRPPEAAYQRGFETSSGLIDPRGAFLSGGTLWHPHRFGQHFTFRLRAWAPQGWEVVSQGQMTEHGLLPESAAPPDERSTVTWVSAQPMEEIYLVAGPYRLRQEQHQGVAVQTFTYGNDDQELCRRYLDATKEYLDLYTGLIGPYPFAKFALVENFWQTGYGMPSFTLLGNRVIRLPFIVRTSYGHEILHNWWGNGVFVDWEQGNWCEGLTVYGADYLYKERESAQAACDYRRTLLQGYLDYVRGDRDFALTQFRARHDASSQAIGYGKAMMVFHMLRRSLGDDLFWEACGKFYERYLFHNASWHDVLGVFAEVSGRDLTRFYDEWIARTGAPALRITEANVSPLDAQRVRLEFTLTQEEPPYALEVPVRVTLRDGRQLSLPVRLDGRQASVRHDLPGAPRMLAVDPDFDLFRRLHRDEVPIALSQVMGADSLVAVLPSALPPAMETAYREMVKVWRPAAGAGVLSDRDVPFHRLGGAAVWLLGEPSWLDRLAPSLPDELVLTPGEFRVGGQVFDRATHTLVVALPHPVNDKEALGLILAPDENAINGIGRKIPHYGKYSYLVFEGETNVAKGMWSVARSPLMVVWEDDPTAGSHLSGE